PSFRGSQQFNLSTPAGPGVHSTTEATYRISSGHRITTMAVITFVAASKGRLVRCPTTWGWSLPFRSVRNLRNDCRRCRLPPPGVRYLHWLARMRHTFAKNPGTVLPGPEQPRSSHGSLYGVGRRRQAGGAPTGVSCRD